MQNLFYGWLDTIIIPQIPAKEKEKTQRNIKKRGGHLWGLHVFVGAGKRISRCGGSCAPVSLPRMRLPPKLLRSTTWPGRLAVTRPIWAAPRAAGHRLQRRQNGRRPSQGRRLPASGPHRRNKGGPGPAGCRRPPQAGPPGWRLPPARCTGTSLRQIRSGVVATPPRVGSRSIRTPPASRAAALS